MFCNMAGQEFQKELYPNWEATCWRQTLQHNSFKERHPSDILLPHFLTG
jgi:hypothetical protein